MIPEVALRQAPARLVQFLPAQVQHDSAIVRRVITGLVSRCEKIAPVVELVDALITAHPGMQRGQPRGRPVTDCYGLPGERKGSVLNSGRRPSALLA